MVIEVSKLSFFKFLDSVISSSHNFEKEFKSCFDKYQNFYIFVMHFGLQTKTIRKNQKLKLSLFFCCKLN